MKKIKDTNNVINRQAHRQILPSNASSLCIEHFKPSMS